MPKWIDISKSALEDFCVIIRCTYNVLLTQWVMYSYCWHSGFSVTYEVQILAFQVIASLSTGLVFGSSFNVPHHKLWWRYVQTSQAGRILVSLSLFNLTYSFLLSALVLFSILATIHIANRRGYIPGYLIKKHISYAGRFFPPTLKFEGLLSWLIM